VRRLVLVELAGEAVLGEDLDAVDGQDPFDHRAAGVAAIAPRSLASRELARMA